MLIRDVKRTSVAAEMSSDYCAVKIAAVLIVLILDTTSLGLTLESAALSLRKTSTLMVLYI